MNENERTKVQKRELRRLKNGINTALDNIMRTLRRFDRSLTRDFEIKYPSKEIKTIKRLSKKYINMITTTFFIVVNVFI